MDDDIITNFLPKYPEIDDKNFIQDIFYKKELHDYKLNKEENIPSLGNLYNHQKIISRFFSTQTIYDELLLFHYMGTGKTCTAVACIEEIRKDRINNDIEGALIIVSSKDQIDMFKKQIIQKCTYKKYENFEELKDYYKFKTYGNIASSNTDIIAKQYSKHIIIIDEIHKIRNKKKDDKEKNKYEKFYSFLHKVKNSKILLLTGTPMTDSFDQIIDIMNLILPERIIIKEFKSRYFVIDEQTKYGSTYKFIDKNAENELKKIFQGRISYLKSDQSSIIKKFEGKVIEPLNNFIVYPIKMSNYQFEGYKQALLNDTNKKETSKGSGAGLKPETSKASLFYSKNSPIIKQKNKYILEKKFRKKLLSNGDDKKNIIKKLKIYSCKYSNLIKEIIKNRNNGKCTFVYSEYVSDIGNIFLSLLLDLFGFTEAKSDGYTEKKPRYALFTSNNIDNKQKIIDEFNRYENAYGEYISVIIGSEIISTGNSFFHIQAEYILTPDWNYSTIEQSIARGIRVDSHQRLIIRNEVEYLKKTYSVEELNEELKEDIDNKSCIICGIILLDDDDHYNIKHSIYEKIVLSKTYKKKLPVPSISIYQYVSIFDENKVENIDLLKYKTCEIKDKNNKLIEYLIKTSSFDCLFNINRNKMLSGSERDCEYKDCDYICDNNLIYNENNIDYSTYNLYYSEDSDNLLKIIKNIFSNKFFIDIYNIQKKININIDLLLQYLNKIIENKVIIYNSYGIPCFLNQENNIFYLFDSYNNNNLLMNYYIINPNLQYKNIQYNNNNNDMQVIKLLLNKKNDENNIKKLILSLSSVSIIEWLFEEIFIAKKKYYKTVLSFFKPYYKKFIDDNNKEIYISWIMYDIKNKKEELYYFDDNEWIECKRDNEYFQLFVNYYDKIRTKLDNGFYGYFIKDDFYIVDESNIKITEKNDNRLTKTGRVAKTISKPELKLIIEKLNDKSTMIDEMNNKKNSKDELSNKIKTFFIKNGAIIKFFV